MQQNELEKIITVGDIEKEFNIFNFKVVLRTLTSSEIFDIMKSMSGYDDNAKIQGIQIKTLARSIVSINGKPINYVSDDEEEQITISKKNLQNEKIIGKWQRSVTDTFYSKYVELLEAQSDFLSQYQDELKKHGAEQSGSSENK